MRIWIEHSRLYVDVDFLRDERSMGREPKSNDSSQLHNLASNNDSDNGIDGLYNIEYNENLRYKTSNQACSWDEVQECYYG